MTFETDRLLLRPLNLTDVPAMTGLLQDERVHPWVREDGAPTEGQVRRWIARKMISWTTGTETSWAIVRDGEPLGYVTLHTADRPIRSISFAVSPPVWRQGYASEAVRAVLDRHQELGVAEVWAQTHHDNPASAGLLAQLGFEEQPAVTDPARRAFRWLPGDRTGPGA